MRLGPGENQYFSADDQPISKEKAARLSAPSAKTDLPRKQSSDASTGLRTNLVLRVKRNMTSGYANAWRHRRIAEARNRGELPPAEEERPLTEFEQRRLEILKQAAWHAKLRADRRAKM
jgi:hypothetical protein